MKTLRSLVPLAALLFLALLPPTAYAATTRYAKPTPTGTGDCLSWTNACTLQIALNSSVSGDEIWVMQGTHKPTTGADRVATFQLKNGVAIYGGFAGTEGSFGERNITANVTILSGDIDNNDSQTPIITNLSTVTGNTTNSYHVVSADNTVTASAVLDGFTMTAGYAPGYAPGEVARGYGGGMYNSGSPTLTNVAFIGNAAGSGGGGMYNSGNPTLTNATFSSNSANYGGGMFSEGASPTVMNATFSDNTASVHGGGVYRRSWTSATFTNVTFTGNSAADWGGGMYDMISASLLLMNATFKGNSARIGGGLFNDDSNSTIRNAIFWENTASTGPQIEYRLITTFARIGDSVVQGGCPTPAHTLRCTNTITNDPLLGTFGDYGGSTQTIPLLPGSSALDAGNDAVCMAAPVNNLDQRGVARDMYGDHCDIGAYESRGFAFAKTAGDNQSTLINTVFPTSLDVSVSSPNGEPVNGGGLIFFSPSFGPSTNPPTNTAPIAGGAVSKSLTANGTLGSYSVKVAASNASPGVTFSLTNTVSTVLTSSANPSVSGQAVTLTATVSGNLPTGTISFKEGGANIAGCVDIPLSGGSAACTVSYFALGAHSLTAEYSGDAHNSPSPSPTLIQVVNKANTTTTITSSLNPSTVGQAVVFTVTVSAVAPATGTPTGTVEFFEMTYPSASATTPARAVRQAGATQPLVNGMATFTVTSLAVGQHNLRAEYSGDPQNHASTSNTHAQTVDAFRSLFPFVAR